MDLAHAGERQAVVRQELVDGHTVGGEVELALELTEQEAEGVADLAVRVTHV